jgi:NADPH:quinone reductase-like Zn-dependent oxidoreductase
VPEPVAAADEAVVAVEAFSVNRGEIFSLTGVYGAAAPAGRILGQDIAGYVVVAAADGSGPAVGQRVVGHPDGGGWAERVAVPTRGLAALPDTVSSAAAASLPPAGLTALRLLRAAGPVTGRRLLLTGASGGVGHLLTELAANAGAAVMATPERGRRLRELGAEQVVHSVAAAAGPFDVVLESVGGPEFATAVTKLARAGLVLWFGQASLRPAQLDFFGLLGVTPVTVKHFPHWVADTTDGADVATLVGLVAADRLHPELGAVADWAETAALLADLNARRIRGNAVLTIGTNI